MRGMREDIAAVAAWDHAILTEGGREEGEGGGSQRKRQAYRADERAAAIENETENGRQGGATRMGERDGRVGGGMQGGGAKELWGRSES